MTKSIENDIDTTAYSESMKRLMVNQMINTVAKNFCKQINGLSDAIDKIMEYGKVRKGSELSKFIPPFEMLSGIELIFAERERQIKEKGYTSKHDDSYTDGQLSVIAEKYMFGSITKIGLTTEERIVELSKAGALIAAEIDRLQRLKP